MTDIVSRLDPREKHFRVPGPHPELSLFLRTLAPEPATPPLGRTVLYVHGGTFPSALAIAHRFDGRSWRDELCAADFHVWGLDFHGFKVEFARDIGLAAAPDREIAARAKTTAAARLARDLDFTNIRRYPPEDYAGIVVLRLPDDATARAIGAAVQRFVREEAFLAALKGRLAIIEVDRVRFRAPLI